MKKLISSGSPFEKTMGYSRAVVSGPFCFVSGTTGYDYVKMNMPADVGMQTSNALKTVEGALKEAGFSLRDVVRATYYVSDASYVEMIIPILGQTFGDIRPAATLLIAQLLKPEMKIEIEVTAHKPD